LQDPLPERRIALTLRWRRLLGFRDQRRVPGGGVEREEVVRRLISCIHDLPPSKDHQGTHGLETRH
jgi:hypothetical protein